MIYAKTEEAGKEALKSALRASKTLKQYKQIKVIDLSSSGYKVPAIAEILDLAEATIRRLIHGYAESGLEGVKPKYGESRHLKLKWSKKSGKTYWLKDLWKRARLRVHAPDPLYVVKRQWVGDLKELARNGNLTSDASTHSRSDRHPKQGRLVFLDSTDLHLCPDIGPVYRPLFNKRATKGNLNRKGRFLREKSL